MYMSEALARDRYRSGLESAQQARLARQAAELRRVERVRQRAERRLLRAWQRADELRTMLEAAVLAIEPFYPDDAGQADLWVQGRIKGFIPSGPGMRVGHPGFRHVQPVGTGSAVARGSSV